MGISGGREVKGNITKGNEETFASGGYICSFFIWEGFTGIYICQNLSS